MVKSAPAGGGWVAIAGRLAAELDEAGPAGQEVVLAAASGGKHGVATLKKMVRAYRHLSKVVRSEGIAMDEVRAGLAAIEGLARLDRRSPLLAAGIRADVLRGRINFRELLLLERKADASEAVVSNLSGDWDAFAWRIYHCLFGNAPGGFVFGANRKGCSEIGRLLRVDLEIDADEQGLCAVYLSPRFPFSQGRGRALQDHIARALAALPYYDTVFFVAADAAERQGADRYRDLMIYADRKEAFVAYAFAELFPETGD